MPRTRAVLGVSEETEEGERRERDGGREGRLQQEEGGHRGGDAQVQLRVQRGAQAVHGLEE